MKINDYHFEFIKDSKKQIVSILIRYKNEPAVELPLIDIILQLEKLI